MFGEANPQEQVARSTAPYSGLSAPREAELLAIRYSRRNAHLILLGFVDAPRATTRGANAAVAFARPAAVVARDAALDGDRARGTFHGFFESDHDVALNIFAAFGKIVPHAARAKTSGASARGAEELLEEIAETRAAKMKFLVAAARPATTPPVKPSQPGGGRNSAPCFQFGPSSSYFLRLAGSPRTS